MAVHPWTTFAPVWYGGWFVNRRVRYDLGNTPALAQRIIDFLIARRLPLLAVAVAIAVLAFLPARRLQFERSIESMFAPGDPLLETYQQLKRTFGGNEVVLAVYTDPELFHADGRGIRRVAEVSRRLSAVEGVAATLSIDQPLGERVAVADDGPARRARDLFEGYTHSADGQVAAVVCLLRPEQ